MNIAFPAIEPGTVSFGMPPNGITENQRSFGEIMGTDRRGRAAPTDADREREAAQQLVAVTFIEPILRQAREVRSSEGPFGMTQAEKQFGGMIDAATAKSMVRSWDFPLVDRLARDMRAAVGKQEPTP